MSDRLITIDAHPTWFEGDLYRSLTEARWAMLFRGMGFDFRYEEQAFSTTLGGYLPDFRVLPFEIWLEVKPDNPTSAESLKLQAVVDQTGRPGAILAGFPSVHVFLDAQGALTTEIADAAIHIHVPGVPSRRFSTNALWKMLADEGPLSKSRLREEIQTVRQHNFSTDTLSLGRAIGKMITPDHYG